MKYKNLIALASVALAALAAMLAQLPARTDDGGRSFYELVMNPEPSSRERMAAVRRLSQIRGDQPRQYLLRIAFAPRVPPPIRAEAILQLENHKDAVLSDAVSNLLQPHLSLAIRESAARYIGSFRCESECSRNVLHYLERLWHGEETIENATTTDSQSFDFAEENQAIVGRLYQRLAIDKSATLGVLVQTYGLGTRWPSTFALTVVDRLGLKEACSELENPFRVAPAPKQISDKLVELRKKLKCDSRG